MYFHCSLFCIILEEDNNTDLILYYLIMSNIWLFHVFLILTYDNFELEPSWNLTSSYLYLTSILLTSIIDAKYIITVSIDHNHNNIMYQTSCSAKYTEYIYHQGNMSVHYKIALHYLVIQIDTVLLSNTIRLNSVYLL